jgi:aryl-alcohol dehydrogenase-like predicted oxidoreductase
VPGQPAPARRGRDLYQLHGGADTVAAAEDVVATCEELSAEGKIRSFGTAQDDAETVAVFAEITALLADSPERR